MSALPPGWAAWAAYWTDDLARNGIRGLAVTPPFDPEARARVIDALEPLLAPNVYLPPPSEVGMLVSLDTAALEPGAWVALFRAYAALRSSGAWPDFVSDEHLLGGSVALARFRVLVVPAARWAPRPLVRGISDWVESGGTLIVADPHAFSRAEDGWDTAPAARALLGWSSIMPPRGDESHYRVVPAPGARVLRKASDGAPALTERPFGRGRVLAFTAPLESDAAFWAGILRQAAVPPRPWREAVTARSVGTVSGTYSRPPMETQR